MRQLHVVTHRDTSKMANSRQQNNLPPWVVISRGHKNTRQGGRTWKYTSTGSLLASDALEGFHTFNVKQSIYTGRVSESEGTPMLNLLTFGSYAHLRGLLDARRAPIPCI